MADRQGAARQRAASRRLPRAILLAFLSAFAAAPSLADFADGLAAYDAGDYAAAVAEWRPLAEQGDAEAQLALAGLYADGQGVARDPERAVFWYRQAAAQGDAVAQLNLGDHYARGLGVERDLGLAVYWLTLSARQGRLWPKRRIAELERLLTAAERAALERLLAEDAPDKE